ncbi:MAG: hypothetical protein ABEJ47_01925 [Halorhabdus sp.]
MPIYDRREATDPRVLDRFEGAVGWMAHPDEAGQRASYAVRGDDGVWLFDPLDATGVDALIADLGEVVGVAVLSNFHARDAAAFADRYDVPVFVPDWMDRVPGRVDAPIERYDRTPDLLSTRRTVGGERLTLTLPSRLFPPRDLLGDREPNRILVGHGDGISENATGALVDTLDGARQRLPRAIVTQGPALVAGIAAAFR